MLFLLLVTYLAQVILSSENFKKSICSFRSISSIEPPKSLKRWPSETKVPAFKKSHYFEEDNIALCQ